MLRHYKTNYCDVDSDAQTDRFGAKEPCRERAAVSAESQARRTSVRAVADGFFSKEACWRMRRRFRGVRAGRGGWRGGHRAADEIEGAEASQTCSSPGSTEATSVPAATDVPPCYESVRMRPLMGERSSVACDHPGFLR